MTTIKTPAAISAEIFNRAMKEFEKAWDSHPINDEIEQQYLKALSEKQDMVNDAFEKVDFNLQKGTLIKIDLGASGSEARRRWTLTQRPEGLEEGDILLYTGWFKKNVHIFDKTGYWDSNNDIDQIGVRDKNDDLTEAFSTKIQLFIRGGKEEVWAGLIPSYYYVTLISGSGGPCVEPLFEQDHSLSLNKNLISQVVKGFKKQEEEDSPEISPEPPKAKVPSLTDESQRKTLRKAVRAQYKKEYLKGEASNEARKGHEKAQRGELHRLAKALNKK